MDNIELLKNIRNLILQETDKYLLPDYPITLEQLVIVKEYRQSLRDFTGNNYIFPTKPEFITLLNG
jgi:hypothetical protein